MWIVKLAIVAALFGSPLAYVIYMELKLRKSGAGDRASRSGSLGFASFIKVTAVMVPLAILMAWPSHSKYSFYHPEDSALKIAFKHTGKRKADCDENALIKSEGERYRQKLKETKRVPMNIAGLSGCPRERFPVALDLTLDGRKVLAREYSPTGIKKDMSSYIYEEFIIKPGEHKVAASLFDGGSREKPDYFYEGSFKVAHGEIKLIRFDDRENKLVIE